MSSRIFVIIIFALICATDTNGTVYLSPKSGYMYAPQYPVRNTRLRTLARPETEVKEFGNVVTTKTTEFTTPTVEIDSLKRDFNDRIQNVNEKIPDNIKNDIRQYFRNRLEKEEPTEGNKEKVIVTEEIKTTNVDPLKVYTEVPNPNVNIVGTVVAVPDVPPTTIAVPDVNTGSIVLPELNTANIVVPASSCKKIVVPKIKITHPDQEAVKLKVKHFKNRFGKKTTSISVAENKENVVVDLSSPKVQNIKCNMPKIKNTFSTNFKTLNTQYHVTGKKVVTNFRKRTANLKVKTSVKEKYVNLKSSPKTQICMNKIKTKVPVLKTTVNQRYVSLKTSPKTQIYMKKFKTKAPVIKTTVKQKYVSLKTSPKTQIFMNNIKTNAPLVKTKTVCKLKELKYKAPKMTVRRATPVIITTGELARRRFSRPEPVINIKRVKTNFNQYKKNNLAVGCKVPKFQKKIKTKLAKKYNVNIRQGRILPGSYRPIEYKKSTLYRNGKNIDWKYVKKSLAANKDYYVNTLEDKYISDLECGCKKLQPYYDGMKYLSKQYSCMKHRPSYIATGNL